MSIERIRNAAIFGLSGVAAFVLLGAQNATAEQADPIAPRSAPVTGQPAVGLDYSTETLNLLLPKVFQRRSLQDAPRRDYQGLPYGSWEIYPTLFVGAVHDDNLFQSGSNAVHATGLRLKPSIIAERKVGVHDTVLFANGDFRIFTDYSSGDTTNAQAGFTHSWEVLRDLSIKLGGEYGRHTDLFNNGVITTPFGTAGTLGSPQKYNTFGGSLSGVKQLGMFFVGLGATSFATTYDALYGTTGQTISQSYRDNVVTTANGRFGVAVGPAVYAFADVIGNFRSFTSALYNSQGYRVLGGLGTDRLSLFRGEVYAGYQRQIYEYATFGAPSSPVVGGRVSWYPTRDLTVTTSVDETFTDSALTTTGNPTGSAARQVAANTIIAYDVTRDLKASVNGGYGDLSYISGGRHDHRWSAGTELSYEIFRNLAATFEYNLIIVNSNATGGSFVRNAYSLGMTYKY